MRLATLEEIIKGPTPGEWKVMGGENYFIRTRYAKVQCKDGFSVSIQTGANLYCIPRDNQGPYISVELGFPNMRPTDEVMEYCENSDNPCATVYGYVPVDAVRRLIEAHGGELIIGRDHIHTTVQGEE